MELDINWDPSIDEEKGLSKAQGQEKRRMDDYRKLIKTWRIYVFNSSASEAAPRSLRLFPEVKAMPTAIRANYERNLGRLPVAKHPPRPDDSHMFFRIGGPLDVNICPTETDAQKVAAEACSLLNKYPLEIDESEFPEESDFGVSSKRPSTARNLIELMALQVLRSDFDFWRISRLRLDIGADRTLSERVEVAKRPADGGPRGRPAMALVPLQ